MSEPTSKSWTVEKFQDQFKRLYDVVVSSAKRKFSDFQNIAGLETTIIPWDAAKIDMHFQDPESGEQGTVAAFKALEIPIKIFDRDVTDANKSGSKDGYHAAAMNIFINPIINAIKDAFEAESPEYARLYCMFGTGEDGLVKVYVIFNGEISDESEMHFTTDKMNRIIMFESPLDDYSATKGFMSAGKKSDKDSDWPPVDTSVLQWPEFEKNFLNPMKILYAKCAAATKLYAKEKNLALMSDFTIDTVGSKITTFDELVKSESGWFTEEAMYMQMPYACLIKVDAAQLSRRPEFAGVSSKDLPNAMKTAISNPLRDILNDILRKNNADARFFISSVFSHGLVCVSLHFWQCVSKYGHNDTAVESVIIGSELKIISNEISLEKAILKVRIPKYMHSNLDILKILIKGGLEKTIKDRIKEILAEGKLKPIDQVTYKKLYHGDTTVDKEFLSGLSTTYADGIPICKEKRVYTEHLIGGVSCILGTVEYLPISRISFGKNPGMKFLGVWIRVYSEKKDKIYHIRVAKSSYFFGEKLTRENAELNVSNESNDFDYSNPNFCIAKIGEDTFTSQMALEGGKLEYNQKASGYSSYNKLLDAMKKAGLDKIVKSTKKSLEDRGYDVCDKSECQRYLRDSKVIKGKNIKDVTERDKIGNVISVEFKIFDYSGVGVIIETKSVKKSGSTAVEYSLKGAFVPYFVNRTNSLRFKKITKADLFDSSRRKIASESGIATEGLFGFGSGDMGLSCNPALINVNKQCMRITPKHNIISIPLNRVCDGTDPIYHSLVGAGVGQAINSVYLAIQRISPDWNFATSDDIKAKAFDIIWKNFPVMDIFGRWRETQTGNSAVECWTHRICNLGGVIVVGQFVSIRPEGYDDKAKAITMLANLFAVMYNASDDTYATPIVATTGWLYRIDSVGKPTFDTPIVPKFAPTMKNTSIDNIRVSNKMDSGHIASIKTNATFGETVRKNGRIKSVSETDVDVVPTNESAVNEINLIQEDLRLKIKSIDPAIASAVELVSVKRVSNESKEIVIAHSPDVVGPRKDTSVFAGQTASDIVCTEASRIRIEQSLQDNIFADDEIESISVSTENGFLIVAHLK